MPEPNHSETLSKTSDVLHRILVHTLPCLYFLITVSFYLRTYDSAQIKISFCQIGGITVLALWVIKILIDERLPFSKRDWLYVAPFVALLGSGFLSFLHSPFKPMALDETLRRVFYMGFALIIMSEFQTEESAKRFLRWIMAAAITVLAYGLIQYLDTRLFSGEPMGLDPFVWRSAFSYRVFSTFGNPNFFGNFLVLITPILIAQYLRFGGQVGRLFLVWGLTVVLVWLVDAALLHLYGPLHPQLESIYEWGLYAVLAALLFIFIRAVKTGSKPFSAPLLLLMSLLLINLYSTETKGAWVGFTVAVVVTLILLTAYFVQGESAVIRKLLLGMAVAILLGSSFLLIHYTRKRMQSVSFRVFTWISTWEMIRTHPVLGSGIGSFKVTYPAFRRPQIILLEGKSNTETDHAEDEYLEIWHDEGIVGFGIYLWFLFMVIRMGLSHLKQLCFRKGIGPKGKSHLEIGAGHPHAYDLLGYLAAFCGGLMHWFMDVSVRFVSSGIYFALLPAMVARLSEGVPIEATPLQRPGWERRIRAGVVLFWCVVMLSFQMRFFLVLISGLLLWGLQEGLERGLPIVNPTAPSKTDSMLPSTKPLGLGRALAIFLAAVMGLRALVFFRDIFIADLHHNVAIFFSKASLWAKTPEFDARAGTLPPEIQEAYRSVGGALENYAQVERLNPSFPMAPYFMGNVYNDWGSQVDAASLLARGRGDLVAAETLKDAARKHWLKALEAYERTRRLAPNYVQTHHQEGLVHQKIAQQAFNWGDNAMAEREFTLALECFKKYRELDPAYLGNHAQMALLYIRRKDFESVTRLYEDALHLYQMKLIYRFPDREAEILVNLGKAHYLRFMESHAPGRILSEDPDVKASEECFEQALHYDPQRRDAAKDLAILYTREGRRDKARAYWERLRQMNPQDPDVQAVFRSVLH